MTIHLPTWNLVEGTLALDKAWSLQNALQCHSCKKTRRSERRVLSQLLVLNQRNVALCYVTHLNIGVGWPWAWHKRTRGCSAIFVSVVLLNSRENDGALDPIGSVTVNINVFKVRKSYLNIGTGNACAWHKSAKSWPVLRVIPENWTSFEKVGDFEPTGSTISNKIFITFTWMMALGNLGLDTGYSDSVQPLSRTKRIYYQ